jgi:hypothetical protein
MAQFLWIDWNLAKIEMHHLSTDEVEFAWAHRIDVCEWDEPEPRVESYGRVPNGRWVKVVWRYNGIGDGDLIFVITAYHVPQPPPGRRKVRKSNTTDH